MGQKGKKIILFLKNIEFQIIIWLNITFLPLGLHLHCPVPPSLLPFLPSYSVQYNDNSLASGHFKLYFYFLFHSLTIQNACISQKLKSCQRNKKWRSAPFFCVPDSIYTAYSIAFCVCKEGMGQFRGNDEEKVLKIHSSENKSLLKKTEKKKEYKFQF